MSTATIERPLATTEHPYYSFGRLDSYNAQYNMAVGGRGIGKTYGRKLKAIKAALDKGDEFIYLRRYKEELKASKNTFIDDLIANGEFGEWEFKIDGTRLVASGIEFAGEKKREWRTLGYFISLSTGQQQKSVAFPRVKTIIFDEFIIEKGNIHYLPDEANVFNNFYSTVDRGKDKTKVYFLANAVSINNPYFIEWEINEFEVGDIVRRKKLDDGSYFIACEIVDSSAYGDSLRKTKFGQFIKDTAYEEYAVGNQFSDNNEYLLEFKDGQARYIYTLITAKGAFSVWHNGYTGTYYAQKRRPKEERIYVTEPHLMREDRNLMLRNDKLQQYLRAAFNKGGLMFDAPQTRNSMIEIFRR
ncbi:DNA encapsidation ATPase [Curtobacterium phage Ayka]|nr:DNA encapsidation ATPase [Curtobacterium phage Ayka]